MGKHVLYGLVAPAASFVTIHTTRAFEIRSSFRMSTYTLNHQSFRFDYTNLFDRVLHVPDFAVSEQWYCVGSRISQCIFFWKTHTNEASVKLMFIGT